MTDTRTLTVNVPSDMLDDLESLAQRTGRGMDELASEVFAGYLERRRHELAAIAAAEADEGGQWVAHEDVMRWLESWETPNELPPPL